MSALEKNDSPNLHIFVPGGAHGTITPVRSEANPIPRRSWETQTLAASAAKIVSPEQRESYAMDTTLPQFYRDCVGSGAVLEIVGSPDKVSGTYAKYEQALKHWVRATRPDDWPIEEPWEGPSLAFLERASDVWLSAQMNRFVSVGGLAATTVNGGIANSIRALLNHAIKIGAITRAPQIRKLREEQRIVPVYSRAELQKLLHELLKRADPLDEALAVAVVLGCRIGARMGDLFALRREQFQPDVCGRMLCHFHAEKNRRYQHKSQAVPVSRTAWRIIERWTPGGGLLFPELTSECKEPERSRSARRRNARIGEVLRSIGCPRSQPWQSCRQTCNNTLEAIQTGIGDFALAHSLKGVGARSYREPSEEIFAAIEAVKPVEAELQLAGLFVPIAALDGYCGVG